VSSIDVALQAQRRDLARELVASSLLMPTDLQGIYEKGPVFEDVLARVDAAAHREGADQHAERKAFSPLVSRATLDASVYTITFPHFAGTVNSFFGTDQDHVELIEQSGHGEGWSAGFRPTGAALAPAACYAVYPTLRGALPHAGRIIEVESWCFRHEPSDDPARMQTFRMREFVRVADAETVRAFRDAWVGRSERFLRTLGLEPRAVLANDPFFGRAGQLLARTQREQSLKYELVVPIVSPDHPTAVMSCNYHQDHFGEAFGITTAAGAVAHSACVGFGLERITLALFRAHGPDPVSWNASVRQALGW